MKKSISFLILFLMLSPLAFAGRLTPVTKAKVTVTTPGTAVVLGTVSETFYSATICAEEENTQAVVVGDSSVDETQATRRGDVIWGGTNTTDCVWLGGNDNVNGNLADYYIDAEVAGEGVTITRYVRS